ncbi:Beige protein-like 1 [Lecanora helva]
MSRKPRSRASTLQDTPEAVELRNQICTLRPDDEQIGTSLNVDTLHVRLSTAHRIRQSLLGGSEALHLKDVFRHVDGFEAVIVTLRQVCLDWTFSEQTSEQHHALSVNLFQAILGFLAAALQQHRGNQKYFRQRIGEEGGWIEILCILCSSLFDRDDITESRKDELTAETLGCLFALALNDESHTGFFKHFRRSLEAIEKPTAGSGLAENTGNTAGLSTGDLMDRVQTFCKAQISSICVVFNADAVMIMFELWRKLQNANNITMLSTKMAQTLVFLPSVIRYLATLSTRNLVALHGTGLLTSVIHALHSLPHEDAAQKSELYALACILLQPGVSDLDDAHFLFRNARSSPLFADLLLESLKSSRSPPYIHFDLSLSGFASVELPGIGRAFPPTTSSPGYSLSLWFQVVHYDPDAHTTIFGAFDASQTCFVLVYLERDTHNLILQTSVSSSRPSVRFKTIAFSPQRWYHVVITHRRPKTTSSARASLFVDGEFVEQVKSQYPATAPSMKGNDTNVSSPASNRRSGAIQAFLGTPQDLATKLGKGMVHTQWRLASANLLADVLSDDLVAVYFELGPRYFGNFQDCLGSFQTYRASAALNLRNESLHPGKDETSDVVTAIRSKASSLLPEANMLLNISANVVLDDDDHNNIDETHLLELISKGAGKNLRNVTKGGRNALAINGSVPSINEALLQPSGFAILTGDPVVVVPQSLDDAAWRIGGCAAVGLALVEAARDPHDVLRSLSLLFESVQDNWRNSEAMERENGFGVLSNLLSTKMSQQPCSTAPDSASCSQAQQKSSESFVLQILVEVLRFVGFDINRPENSVINNPLAYRILLVDMEFWRRAEARVQKLYYEQFLVFGVRSKYHLFNSKRLSRMRIARKWLDALKGEAFTAQTFSYFLETFKSMFTKNLSTDIMRSLALYITYAIHKPKQKPLTPSRGKSVKINTDLPARRKTLGSPSPNSVPQQSDIPSQLTQLQIALRMLTLYTELLCRKNDRAHIHKFARTVTNKWLLHLLADDEPTVVVLATKILARLLVVSGPGYVEKFINKSGGVTIMQHRLKRWWNNPTIWPICFAILFGVDVADIDFSRTFDLYGLLEVFASTGKVTVAYPAVLPIITALLGEGLKSVTRNQSDPDSPMVERKSNESVSSPGERALPIHSRQRSITLNTGIAISSNPDSPIISIPESASTLRVVTRFLADIHTKSSAFRDFTTTSLYVQEMFFVLFPIVVSANPLSPEMELHSRDSALTFKGGDVIMRPLSANAKGDGTIVRMSTVESSDHLKPAKPPAPKRMSSYVLVTSNTARPGVPTRNLPPTLSPGDTKKTLNFSSSLVQELLELTIAVYADQIFSRKDFPGLGLFMRVPPGFQEHQAYFETFILRNTISQLGNTLKLDQKLLWEPRVLTNIARFATHLCEAIYEGWFINGADDTLEFLANILEYLHLPDVASIKAVRLCSQIIANIRSVLFRVVLLRLSELDETTHTKEAVAFLNRLVYWQTVLLPVDDSQQRLLKLLCFLVYNKFISTVNDVRMAAANLWRMLLVQKPEEIANLLTQADHSNSSSLVKGFQKIMELDNETFLSWMDDHNEELQRVLFSPLSRSWETFVAEEDRKTEETARARINKRREKLRLWVSEASTQEEILRRHDIGTDHWRSNIFAAEHLKRQRALQDQQDTQMFNVTTWSKMTHGLRRPGGLLHDEDIAIKWQLDQTEGRNRMRLRFIPDRNAHLHDYQPKRTQSQDPTRQRRSVSGRTRPPTNEVPPLPDQPKATLGQSGAHNDSPMSDASATPKLEDDKDDVEEDGEDFEIVEGPSEDPEEYEDKNRKVMRSLQRGDQVEYVHNVSRIIGLEAIEGLLILGKSHLYLLDNLFQRMDGEVVNVWQAPHEERDPYLQMISGRESGDSTPSRLKADFETRSWRWQDVLSISKRRFLFRDVAIEVFFVDGRSYLLTANTPSLRDELYQKLLGKASSAVDRGSAALGEDAWRIDALRNPGDEAQTIGSKFTSVFAHGISNPATRKWLKGEMSNFHYLVFINTMAGRTFNDLTQYPVFPWVLADYTSEDLDLSNPRTFRDLSKPMGCQNADRQAEFRDRYQSFAEMGDANSPPFHYGTHYSSAMIVTSYLIRLQPFVHSYLLLQGGNFDHPDRLFYSIEKAWSSASRDNMTDVRELIPEFYYLPEFLTNQNQYDFGTRQGDGGTIDNVCLPPWAKGDPKIFISKHREALESEYVSQHLHQWIDLVFGHKQRGEAALEATNVFHHLSYHGAKNLDTIHDPVERLATIGIIHNFGQTPHQIFQRTHPPREDGKQLTKRLDTNAEGLTRLPFPLIESHDRISNIQHSTKNDRLVCSGPFRLDIGPAFDKYMEWGFIDGSVRFFTADSRKLIGLFEHVHQGQLSSILFADSKTLVTGGSDCTVSLWTVITTAAAVDLQPKTCLFGHRAAITVMAVSRSFRALLSASSDGEVLLWDLNRLELVRRLTMGAPVECARINDVSGMIMLCRKSEASLWTLNGDLVLEQDVHVEGDDLISSCAFYEGSGIEYLERDLVFTGHRKGVVNVWNIAISDGTFTLEHVKRMHHLDHAGYNIGATITSILPMAQKVYTGDDDGRVVSKAI